MNFKNWCLIILGVLILARCQNPHPAAITTATHLAANSMACDDLESHLWDVSYAIAQSKIKMTPQEISNLISKNTLNHELAEFYQIHTDILNSQDSVQKKLEQLTALEIGKASDTQIQLKNWRANFKLSLKNENLKCDKVHTTGADPELNLSDLLMTGAKKTFAVAYQSCSLEQLPPMKRDFPNLSGIENLGNTPSGGTIREIVDLPAFLNSDYYYRDFSLGAQCKDLRLNPLIYNFGGKPDIVDNGSFQSLNLFAHGADGEGVSPQLGIDCSAYVFTAIATSGLRLAPNKPLKPILVYGLGSSLYLDPQNNGLNCLDKVSMGISGTFKNGDILAMDGHVAIIGDVGADPLGILSVQRESQCDTLTEQNFDFVVYQSSSSKNGVGINKYVGKDFMFEDGTFRTGLIEYAHQACHARFKNQDVLVQSNEIQADRFKNTPACQQASIHLSNESCVSSCYP